jgi:threonine dehydrogenase-like Zn-dependent dehydrogenase
VLLNSDCDAVVIEIDGLGVDLRGVEALAPVKVENPLDVCLHASTGIDRARLKLHLRGQRVVLDPVLACATRGEEPPCASCAAGATGRCDRVTVGHVSPGLQTGYCADTGGGWGGRMVAHRSQLYAVPDSLGDEQAVLIEPLACALHAVLRARVDTGDSVLVIGAGTVGLLTLLALREFTEAKTITVVAKHPAQQDLARRFGADEVVGASDAVTSLRRSTHAMRLKPERGMPYLLGGVDIAFEAVGSKASLDLALRTTKAGMSNDPQISRSKK